MPHITAQGEGRLGGMDAVCFSRHGWRCYTALGGVFSQKKLPSFKNRMDAVFKAP